MSTFNRNTLALALAAALLPASAFAFDAQTMGDTVPETIAQQVGTTLATSEAFTMNIDAGDNIIGRTQGFNIKLTLLDGATFATTGNLLGGVVPGAGLVPGGTAWSTSVVGGAPGTTVLQVQLSNNSDGAFVGTGALLGPVTFDLQNVSTTGLTRVLVELIDPGTGGVIINGGGTFAFTSNIIVRSDGLAFSCLAQPNADLIDVAGDGGAIGPKAEFVPFNAAIGFGPFSDTAELGTITLATTGGFTLQAGDTIHSVITGTNLTNISDLFLDTVGNNCSTPAPGLGAYVIDLATDTAKLGGDTMPSSAAGAGVDVALLPGFVPSGATVELCITVNGGTDQIEAQQFTVVNGFNGALEPDACNVSPLAFNGSVIKVFTFNPAGNTTQESFARVTNWGNTAGKVTVEGWDDAGAAATGGNITFNLAAGQSLQLNSGDLENGNTGKGLTGAFGDGAGKWRLVFTGEFDGMHVTSLNRNNTVGTLTNLTDSDNRGEQVNDGK